MWTHKKVAESLVWAVDEIKRLESVVADLEGRLATSEAMKDLAIDFSKYVIACGRRELDNE